MSLVNYWKKLALMIVAAIYIQSCAVLSTNELQDAETLGNGNSELYLNMPYVPNPSVLYSKPDSNSLSFTPSLLPFELGLRSGISSRSDIGISCWSGSLATATLVGLAEGLANYDYNDEEEDYEDDDEWVNIVDHGLGFDFGVKFYWKYRITDPRDKVQIAVVFNLSGYYAGAKPQNGGVEYHSISCGGFSPALIFSNKINPSASFYYGFKLNFYTFDYSSERVDYDEINKFISDSNGRKFFLSPFLGLYSDNSMSLELGYIITTDRDMTELSWDRIILGFKFII